MYLISWAAVILDQLKRFFLEKSIDIFLVTAYAHRYLWSVFDGVVGLSRQVEKSIIRTSLCQIL
jgi:hypothetical protein